MYAGHFAAGLALKARYPRASTAGLLVGVSLLDLLFGPLVLLGIERASVTPGASPGFALDFIDWSHSLAMAVVWAVLYGALFLRSGRTIAAVMGLAVFSHFILDLPMHPPDLALWPGASVHLGFGLWQALPVGWWFLELAFIVAGLAFYWRRARTDRTFGHRAAWVASIVVFLHITNSPWVSPL